MNFFSKFSQKLIILIAGFVALSQLKSTLDWGHDSWQITEWLIHYPGQFVRRGLSGEIMLLMSAILGIPVNILIIIVCYILFIILLTYLAHSLKEFFSLAFFMSPLALGASVYGHFIVRKDIFEILCLICCLLINKNAKNTFIKIISFNFFALVGILSHETFFLYGVLGILALNTLATKHVIKNKLFYLYYFSPSLLAFIISIYYHGNEEISLSINTSLQNVWSSIDSKNLCNCQHLPGAAIDALRWDIHKGMSLSLSLLGIYSYGIWVPLAWLTTILGCYFFTIYYSLGYHPEKKDKIALSNALIIQFLLISPLFILGWDFGRWIFTWVISSIIFMPHYIENGLVNLPLIGNISKKLCHLEIFNKPKKYSFLLFLAVPVCCWSVSLYIRSTPLGYLLDFFVPTALVNIH